MKLKYSYVILLVAVVIFSQCKKKKEEPTPTAALNTNPVDTNAVDTTGTIDTTGTVIDTTGYTDVCTPKTGNTQYVPLKVKNTFTYSAGIITVNSKIVYDTVAFGKTYFVATYSPAVLPKSYQRYNSAGDLVGLDSIAQGKGTEAVLIPANPTVTGSPYLSNSQGTSTVISTNASLSAATTTGTCSYSGLLQIDVYSATQGTTSSYYYKPGIGLVYITCLGPICANAYLKSMRIY